MDKKDVIEFFDRCAPDWDAELIRNDSVIDVILDNAGVHEGVRVLDVACGTGVLVPDYLSRGAASVTGIDISGEMIKIARSKFDSDRVHFICGDAEEAELPAPFDCVVVYNAFPHFPDPQRLIERLSGLLAPGGTLTVAHGMSRRAIDGHHSGPASKVSVGLMSVDELAGIFAKNLRVTVKISDDRMYQVAGVKD